MVLNTSLCVVAAVVSVTGRQLHCCFGRCQPDPDERRPEWDKHHGSGQEEGGHEPRQSKSLQCSILPASVGF